MARINLTETQAKSAIKNEVKSVDTYQQIRHSYQQCTVCKQNKSTNFGRSVRLGTWHCQNCMNKRVVPSVDNIVKKLVSASESAGKANKKKEDKLKSEIEIIAQPYIDAGLGEPFAHAIAKDPSVTDSVMDLWEADWWRQYEVNDILICSVLDGNLKEDDAKWLNTVRSDHEDLVLACIGKKCTVSWARALLDSGFLGDSDGVASALTGAEPKTIARIRRKIIDVNLKIVPPALKKQKKITEKKKPKTKKVQTIDFQRMEKNDLVKFCMRKRLPYSGSRRDLVYRLEEAKNILQSSSPPPKTCSVHQLKNIARRIGLKGRGASDAYSLRKDLLDIGLKLGADMKEE